MKHLLKVLMLLLIVSTTYSCKKDNNNDDDTGIVDLKVLNNGVTTCEYAPFTLGSTFVYEQTSGTLSQEATWTAESEETIDGKTYVKVSGFGGLSDEVFFNCESGVYNFIAKNAQTVVGDMDLVYMKEDVPINTTWGNMINQSALGIDYTTRYEWTYAGTQDSRVVNGVTYNDILHIHLDAYTTANGPEILFSQDEYYWAKGIGLIEKVGTTANFKLISYNIQ